MGAKSTHAQKKHAKEEELQAARKLFQRANMRQKKHAKEAV